MRKYSLEQISITLIIALSIITSLIQFLYNPSLWQDEAALALNIIHRNSSDLLKPLDYGQVAPILFLQIEKLFSTIWPNSEYGLRLFPLLCFWASILLFNQITKKQIHSIYARIAALSFFAFGYMFIYYSTEIKQYMSDVFVLLCMLYLLLKDYKNNRAKYYLLGVVGIIAVFLSNLAPVILFTCGIYLFYEHLFMSRIKNIIPLFIVGIIWLSTFLLYYCFFIYNHPQQEFMQIYWFRSGAFLPLAPFTIDLYVFLFEKVPVTIFSAIFALNESKMQTKIIDLGLGLLFIAGITGLIRSKNKLIIICCIPMLLHLLLSAFQIYPFARRLILYTLPGIIVVCSFGFDYILTVIFPKLKIEKFRLPALVFLISIICVSLFVRFPIEKVEMKKCIKYIQSNVNAEEYIYSFHNASVIFQYYKDIGFVNSEVNIINDEKVKPSDFGSLISIDEYLKSDLYIHDLKRQFSNKKVWLLISGFDGEEFIVNKIDSLGYNRIKEFKTKGVSVYLYDFGEGE
jgi:hypothetical protein